MTGYSLLKPLPSKWDVFLYLLWKCLFINECTHLSNYLEIRDWVSEGVTKLLFPLGAGMFLLLHMHLTTWRVCWEISFGRDLVGGLELVDIQNVWVYLSLHCITSGCEAQGLGGWFGEKGEISGNWPRSSCLCLTVYCDTQIMRLWASQKASGKLAFLIYMYVYAIKPEFDKYNSTTSHFIVIE